MSSLIPSEEQIECLTRFTEKYDAAIPTVCTAEVELLKLFDLLERWDGGVLICIQI